jgi:hypothetical protein
MPVNDGIVIGKVGPVLNIQKRTAVAVLGTVVSSASVTVILNSA